MAAAIIVTSLLAVDVDTTAGVVRGRIIDGVATFRGIPYAAAPTGELRWRNPVPAASWNGTLDALKDAPGCPQHCGLPAIACPPVQSEDCLALNVFAPAKLAHEKRAVLFWIHGGDFYQGYGGGALYDGSSLVKAHDLVVVAINYRLGALGFLYSGSDPDKNFRGNFGLADQRLALEWARDNVARFGGDPNRVTIAGQSAGGMSVASHLCMAKSQGLFARAIIESDPFGLPFRTAKTYPSFSKTVARYAGCSHQRRSVISAPQPYEPCMRSIDYKDIVAAQVKAQKDLLVELGHFLDLFVPFSPVVGVDDFHEQPLAALVHGRMHDVPIIMGSVSNETLLFIWEAFPKSLSAIEEEAMLGISFGFENTSKILKQYPRPATEVQAEEEEDVGEEVSAHKTEARPMDTAAAAGAVAAAAHASSGTRDLRVHATNITNDALFYCPIRHAAIELSKQEQRGARKSPTYVYHFDHVISYGGKFWRPKFPECVDSVCHSEELPFVFDPNTSILNASFTADETRLTTSMQEAWGGFVRTASPGGVWPPFETHKEASMLFRTPSTAVEYAAYAHRCGFWDQIGYEWVLKP